MSWCQILQPFQFFFLFNWYFFPFESCFHVTHLVTGNDYNTRVKAAILLVPKSAWLSSLWLSSTIAALQYTCIGLLTLPKPWLVIS